MTRSRPNVDLEFLSTLDFRSAFTVSDEINANDEATPSPYDTCSFHSNYWDTVTLSNYLSTDVNHCSTNFFLHLNIQGLDPKFDEFKSFLKTLSNESESKLPTVIALSETWLNEFNHDAFSIPGYMPLISDYRKDNSSRGGISLCIKEGNDFIERKDLNIFIPTIFESLFITLKPSNLTVGVIYRTPDSNRNEFLIKYNETLESLRQSNHPFLLLGDYNLNLLNYSREASVTDFVNTTFEHGCIPVISKPTRVGPNSATCIDNIIASKLIDDSFSGILVEDVSDHFPVFFCFPKNMPRSIITPSTEPPLSYNLCKKNLKKLHMKLDEHDWNDIFHMTNPSTAATLLNKTLSNMLDLTCSPAVRKKVKKQIINQPWFTTGLKVSCKRKKSLYKKALKNLNRMASYRKYRNTYNKLVRLAKQNYYSKSLLDAQHDIKKTWAILKEIILKNSSKCSGVQKLNVTLDNSFSMKLVDQSLIAEYFNNFFSSVGSRTSSSIPQLNIDPLDLMNNEFIKDSMFLIPTDVKEIIEIALSVKSKTSTGHDKISNKLVKEIIPSIAKPLVHIFNVSFQTGIFPDIYKLAKVIPVFKAGDKSDPNNYRPISLLPAFAKILEKLVHKRLMNFLFKHDIIYPQQYGFLKGRSTEQAMTDIILKITHAIELNQLSLGIFLDLSKAFDTISHKILLRKMYKYGVRGNSLEWFQSYLSDRLQYVLNNNATSSLQSIDFGVPQGSVLGPLLFLIYINDMPSMSTVLSYILFADDTTALYSSPSIDYLFQTVNTEITKLNTWFAANKLLVNATKTNFVLFMNQQKEKHISLLSSHKVCMNHTEIKQKDSVKFLGLLLDKNINFKSHVDFICTKLSKSLFALRRAANVLQQNDLKTLYSALFLPYLNYGILIWGGICKRDNQYSVLDHGETINPMGHLSKIHVLQKRAIRVISKSNRVAHHIPLLYHLEILDLHDLYSVKALSFFYDYFYGNLPPILSNIITFYYSRNNQLFIKTQYRRTNVAACSIIHTLPVIWNPLPAEIKSYISKSKRTFLTHVKAFFISKYFEWKCEALDCGSCSRIS